MKLHTLRAVNFMPYRGEMQLEFPQDEQRNVMIVFGDNMRGKTSLLNAIRWAFYGKAVGRHSRTISLVDIFNKDASQEGDWHLEVRIEFEANGHLYDLRRSADRRPLVPLPSRSEDFQMSVYMSKDGAVVSGDTIEAEIDQFAPEQISRFFLFDGELLQEYESLLIEGNEQGRQIKDAIEEVLGVPALIRGRDELGTILKVATKRQNSDLQTIQGLERQVAQQRDLTVKQDAFDRDIGRLTLAFEENKAKKNGYQDELNGSEDLLAQKHKLDGLRNEKKNLDEQVARHEDDRRSLLGDAWQDLLDAKLEVRRQTLTTRQAELHENVKAQARLEHKTEQLRRMLANGNCATCGQPMIGEDHRHDLGTQLGNLEVQLSKVTDSSEEIQSISASLAALNKIRGVRAKDRLKTIDRNLRLALVNMQRVENEIERISDEIAGYDTAQLARTRVLAEEAIREEGRLQNEIASVRKNLDQVKSDLAVSRRAIEGLSPSRAQKSTKVVNVVSELERTFAASIERLRDKLRARVGALANDAFIEMTTQKGYRGLQINENYGLTILDDKGRKVAVRSAGAEQIVALSLIDGLNRTGRAVGPVIMDTPFGRLDTNHRDNILSYLPQVSSQFVILVHSGEIRPDTDLVSVKSKIGATYRIVEVSPTHSKIERFSL